MPTVCLVEPEDELRRALETRLALGGKLRVSAFATTEEARRHLGRLRADLALVGDPHDLSTAAALLRQVQSEHPETIRIVLAERAVPEVFRRVPYAHQVAPRHDGVDRIAELLGEAVQARSLVDQRRLRALVSSSNALPAAPALYSELIDLLADPRCSMVRVAEVIQRDVAMSSRLMQMVSSAFFGPATQLSSLGACVAYLGLDLVRSLVLSAEIARSYPLQVAGLSAESVQQRAMSTSRLARRIASGIADESQAFVAGLLHGVGQLVLASRAPLDFARSLELQDDEGLTLREAELETFGATHAEVGAYLLALWGQPLDVVRAVAHQDVPTQSDSSAPGMATVLYLSKRLGSDPDAPLGDARAGLDERVLAEVGVLERLPEFRQMALRLAS